ncbi:hypothetical protein GCM10010372_73110 [Streptomyces tauricus]|uniref:DUF5304 domain-containing protein n=1 Tax=Streptomyces tauricus TaxID=68274 RepID=UPI0016782FDE|nr:DUF5304 domain-containing protein [Streptomyces tauricus]GHA62663.1 hypothetical protein GCM10010372_73110 [Streptomyces tauricus]
MSDERPMSDAGEDALDPVHDDGTVHGGERDEVRTTDDDAWAKACAEDLAAEKARRRTRSGPPPGSAAEELRKLVDAVADKLSGLQPPLLGAVAGGAAQQMVNQVVQQAKAAVEPVIERNPDVFDHLASAGSELLAAYRSAVEAQERRWTARDTAARPRDEGTGSGEHIDLD